MPRRLKVPPLVPERCAGRQRRLDRPGMEKGTVRLTLRRAAQGKD